MWDWLLRLFGRERVTLPNYAGPTMPRDWCSFPDCHHWHVKDYSDTSYGTYWARHYQDRHMRPAVVPAYPTQDYEQEWRR